MAVGGYQIGTAWVQVLPSFQGFHRKVAAEFSRVPDATIDLEPKLNDAKTKAEVARSLNKAASVATLPLKTDTRALDRDLERIKPPTVTPKLESRAVARGLKKLGEAQVMTVRPDAAPFEAKLREIQARRLVAHMAIDAELRKYNQQINDLTTARLHQNVDVDADIAAAKAQLAALSKEKAEIPANVTLATLQARADYEALRRQLSARQVQLDMNTERAETKIAAIVTRLEEDEELRVDTDEAREQVAKLQNQLANLRLQVEHFRAQRSSITIEASAKIDKARQELRDLESGNYRAHVEVDDDIAAVKARIKELERLRPLVRPDIDIDREIAEAQAKIAHLAARKDVVEIQANADTARAEAQLESLGAASRKISNTQADLNIESGDAARAIFLLGVLTTALTAVAHAAPAAGAAVAAVPAALAGAAQGVGAFALGISGVGDAVKALQTTQDATATSAVKAAGSQVAATDQIASANDQLNAALINADRTAIQSAQALRAARQSVADAQEQAARRVEDASRRVRDADLDVLDAERALAGAQQQARDAQLSLTRAREDAAEKIEDLRLALSGAKLDERAATLAVAKAQERLAYATEAGVTGPLMEQIQLEADQANQSLAEAQDRYGDLAKESERAGKAGVAGSDQVIAAQRQLLDSQLAVADAQRGITAAQEQARRAETDLTRARVQGTRDVTEAQERVALAQQQAGWAASDASRQVAAAQRAVARASTSTGTTSAAAIDKVAVAMRGLSPEARDFAVFLQTGVKPAITDLSSAVSSTMLPKFQAAFQLLLTRLPMLRDSLRTTGDVIGDIAVEGAMMVTSGPWTEDFARILSRNNRMLGSAGDAGLSMLDSLRTLTAAGGPFLESLVNSTAASAEQFAVWLQGKRDSGELGTWFAEMGARIRDLVTNISDLADGVGSFMAAVGPLGGIFLDVIANVANFVGNLAQANPVITSILVILTLFGSTLVSLGRSIGSTTRAIRTSLNVWGGLRERLFGVRDEAGRTSNAVGDVARSTDAAGGAAERNRGAVGRLATGFQTLGTAYRDGSTKAQAWATSATSSFRTVATSVDTSLVPAVGRGAKSVDSFLPATTRAGQAMQSFKGTAASTMTSVVGSVGGATNAIRVGLTGAVRGLSGLVGGPFGLAMIAGSFWLANLAEKQAQAAEAAAEHKAMVQSLTDTLVASGGAIDDSVITSIVKTFQNRDAADNAERFGIGVQQSATAIAKGGVQFQNLQAQLSGMSDGYAKLLEGMPGTQALFETQSAALLKTGGSARSAGFDIDELSANLQSHKGISEESARAQATELIQWLDYVGVVGEANSAQRTAADAARQLRLAEAAATTETEKHTTALKELNEAVLASVNKDLAYRQAQTGVADAHSRVADAQKRLTDLKNGGKATDAELAQAARDVTSARQGEETAILAQIAAKGELAAANYTGSDANEKERLSIAAQATEAANLANKYKGTLPQSLQIYLDKLGVARDGTGKWVAQLDAVPSDIYVKAAWQDTDARKRILAFRDFMKNKLSATNILKDAGLAVNATNLRALQQEKRQSRALGAIAVPAYATGGLRMMSAATAEVVPPNQPRLIGDRMRGDEAFIPLVNSPRSLAILAEAARRMGFLLAPMAFGGVRAMAAGGLTTAAGTGAVGEQAALAVNPDAIESLTGSVQGLVGEGLTPLAVTLSTVVDPALATLQTQAGDTVPDAIGILRQGLNQTAVKSAATWKGMTRDASTSTSRQTAALASIRSALASTRTAMSLTASWATTEWARMRSAASDPMRFVLTVFNRGIIAAWNRLNADFAFKKPVAPIPIPFSVGGRVPGLGDKDNVLSALTPGEIVWDKRAIANMGGVAAVERLRRAARAGVIGPDARLGGRPGDGAMRRRLMKTVPLDGLGFAFGGVQPHVARSGLEIQKRFGQLPGGIGGVGARPNISDHPLGLALDFMTLKNTSLGNRIAGYLMANAKRMLLKYVIWQQRFNDGSGWDVMEDRGNVTANHFDHVHASFLRAGEEGRRFRGAGMWLEPITYFANALRSLNRVSSLFPGNRAGQMAADIGRRAVNGVANFASTALTTGGTSGNVESWRPLVLRALSMLDLPAAWADITLRRMAQESGGNPHAVNNWDINAQMGDPSKGLMQVIGATFAAHRDPRAPNNVLDPLANLLASMRYAMSRYGSLPEAYGRPGGYDSGGWLPPGYSTVYNGLSRPEAVLTPRQADAVIQLADTASDPGHLVGELYLSSGEFLGQVRGEIQRANNASGRALARRTR